LEQEPYAHGLFFGVCPPEKVFGLLGVTKENYPTGGREKGLEREYYADSAFVGISPKKKGFACYGNQRELSPDTKAWNQNTGPFVR
jgi:hypothetical protein